MSLSCLCVMEKEASADGCLPSIYIPPLPPCRPLSPQRVEAAMAPAFGCSISFPLSQARSSSTNKQLHHVRSDSLPTCRAHPLLVHLQATTCAVRAWAAADTCCTTSTLSTGLPHLAALHASRRARRSPPEAPRAAAFLDRLLDGLLVLVDAHGTFQGRCSTSVLTIRNRENKKKSSVGWNIERGKWSASKETWRRDGEREAQRLLDRVMLFFFFNLFHRCLIMYLYPMVSVICRSPLIHVEAEFKLSFAPLSRRGLIFELSGKEITQYLDYTSGNFAASARWARIPHNQYRSSSTIFMESSTKTTPESSRRRQPPRVTRQWLCLFRLLAASGHQKLLQTAKRSAFQPASIKFVGAKTIQNQHKHIIG
jgi:hypothetical protein